MKKLFTILLVAIIATGILGCGKEGPRGPRGPAGADGTDGSDGNANVHTFLFTDSLRLSWNVPTGHYIILDYDSVFQIPDSIKEAGMILVYMQYYMNPSLWYFVPGIGPNSEFTTRCYIGVSGFYIQAKNNDGSSWSSINPPRPVKMVRVILVPPSLITTISWRTAKPDFSSYEETADYLGISR